MVRLFMGRAGSEWRLSGTGKTVRGLLLVTAFPSAFHGRRGIVTACADNEKSGIPPALLFPIARPASLAPPIRSPLRPKERKPILVPSLAHSLFFYSGRDFPLC